jgi:ribosome-associated translation inhibitor RaiA
MKRDKMINVKFKNLEKSDLIQQIVEDRILSLINKFPDLYPRDIKLTLEMENSPIQAGTDLFKVKIYITRGRFKGITVTKEEINLYQALAEVMEHMLERLNRFGDKRRVKERNIARRTQRALRKIFLQTT